MHSWSAPLPDRFNIKPDRLIGDTTAYRTSEMLGWMVEETSIKPHVLVWDRASARKIAGTLRLQMER